MARAMERTDSYVDTSMAAHGGSRQHVVSDIQTLGDNLKFSGEHDDVAQILEHVRQHLRNRAEEQRLKAKGKAR